MRIMERKVAIVTGANRGIGFEICKELSNQGIQVILTARDSQKGKATIEDLTALGLNVDFHPLDVSDIESIQKLAHYVQQKYGGLDILINNAGVMIDRTQSIIEAEVNVIRQTMEVNFYGVLNMVQQFVPMMHHSDTSRVINLSSGLGALHEMGAGHPGYRISKTALNALTAILAGELRSKGIRVNSMCPGWVKTDMGGQAAPRSVTQGADTAVWLATAPAQEIPHGKFLRDRQTIDW